jgi:hypothetical protein
MDDLRTTLGEIVNIERTERNKSENNSIKELSDKGSLKKTKDLKIKTIEL